ncbi:hypothetical protein DOZ80_30290 [Pseudomonas fluorescens]|uniref:Uncharacterized protein n=1 Tax=Pseudomonas fluorescens TaxID=294 RepID=A0A327MK76_PSEFL|nr:hypothetical protein DOZ80_30290 [Pseudomonas fluorescens]
MGKQFTAWSRAWLCIRGWIEHKGNQGLSGQISTLAVFSLAAAFLRRDAAMNQWVKREVY